MFLYPAIDLYQGQAVRLEKGDFSKLTVYSKQPAAVAKQWEDEGARWLHVVDLEGAKTGILENFQTLRKIRQTVGCKIQFGGGLRTLEQIQKVLGEGIDRVILGTKVLDTKFCGEVSRAFGKQLAVSIDTREGKVQTQGWLAPTPFALSQLLQALNDFPIQTIIYTDIQRDGMLSGPNLVQLKEILAATRADVILSGGISSLEDLKHCKKISQPNFQGVIVGKALYEKRFGLADALQLLASE